MNHILREHDTDVEVVLLVSPLASLSTSMYTDMLMQVLTILGRWPLLVRNTIESCKIDVLVKEIAAREGNPQIQALGTTVSPTGCSRRQSLT